MYNIFGIATDTKLKNEKGKLITPSDLLGGWSEVKLMIDLELGFTLCIVHCTLGITLCWAVENVIIVTIKS